MHENPHNSKVILHVTNTDINQDSRILKELVGVSQLNNVAVHAFGVGERDVDMVIADGTIHIIQLELVSRRLHFLPRPLRYVFEMLEFSARLFKSGINLCPDIIHSHDTFALPLSIALKLFSRNAALVYDAHELESNKNGQGLMLSLATILIEKLAWPKIDYFITVSDSIKDWYLRKFGNKENCLILNSPVSRGPLEEGDSTLGTNLREKFNIDQTEIIFVYVGILGQGRNLETYLRVFTEVPRTNHLICIGAGPMEREIESYSLEYPNIHHHSKVDHSHLVELLRGADYGLCLIERVSLSDYLCLPNKLFEYLFAGLHVIGSDFPEIRKVLEATGRGVVCGTSAQALFDVIINIQHQSKPTYSDKLEAYTWVSQAERLRCVYRYLISK